MHELSLVQSLLKLVDKLSHEQSAERVVSIDVSIGEFSGVEPDLFRAAFDSLIEETPMRGAKLKMSRVRLESRCGECGIEFQVVRFRFECPDCSSRNVSITRGQELMLESVTVE